MSMVPPPPSSGEFPDRFKFDNPGQQVEGHIVDIRMTAGGDYEPCPVLDIATQQIDPVTGQPVRWSVFCNPISLWRQLHAGQSDGTIVVGAYVRVAFTGHQGRQKIFTLEVAPTGQAPAPAQAQAPQPEQPLGANAPAAPWGGAQPATAGAPAAGGTPPWGQ